MNQIDTETNIIILTDNLDVYIALIDMNIHAGTKLGIVIMPPSPQTAASRTSALWQSTHHA